MPDHPVPLGFVRPAKPVSEMSDAERREFASAIANMMRDRHGVAVELAGPATA